MRSNKTLNAAVRKLLAATAALTLFQGGLASAQTFAVTGGKLVVGDGSPPIDGGVVIVRDGRIVAAGADVSVPADATVIDARGKWVTPGIVASFSQVGLVEVSFVDPTNDTQANQSPFNAAIDIAPAINSQATAVAVSRAGGVTRAIVTPAVGQSIFAGQGAVIDLGQDMDPITRSRVFQFIELGEAGADRAGGSRPSAHVLLRNALREARDLARSADPGAGSPPDESLNARLISAAAERPDDVLLTRFDAAALVPILQGRQLLAVRVNRASDILQVLALKEEFPSLRMILVGAAEGWRVADRIAAAGIPVIASALLDLPESFEQLASTQSNIGRMRAAGVNVSLGTIDSSHQVRDANQQAGNLVALTRVPGHTGLDWNQAFASITSIPAGAVGMGDEIGSLKPGRRGDVVIWDGDPLEVTSAVEAVWIDGMPQSLETRQTRLRDRYRTPQEGALPKAYER